MELTPVTDSLGMPLYRQAKRALIKLIENGRYAPGACLPSESVIAKGLKFTSFEKLRAEEEDALALGIRLGDPVFKICNRLKLSGSLVVFDRICVSALTFKGLTEKRFIERQSTIYNLYQHEFGISVLRAQERARAVLASREVCRNLGVPMGLPVIEVHRIALTFGDKPVEYRVSTINTQHYDYVSLLSKRS